MKSLAILFLVGGAFCNPQYSEEDGIQQHNKRGRSDSDSFESDEVALAGDEDSIGSDSEYSSFESYEVPLAEGDDWRKAALAQVNKLRKKAKLPALTLKKELSDKAQMVASAQCKAGGAAKVTNLDNLAAVPKVQPSTTLVKNGVNKWYNEYKKNDCRPIYEGKKKSDPQYKKVKNYLNLMSKRYGWVGFGLAMNCPRPAGTGFVVARFGGLPGGIMRMVNGELAAQGLTRSQLKELDISQQAPCPKSFKP